MPRWHHSDSSSERYQEVKSIKTFYAAHISRSQAKSMFGNWTRPHYSIIIKFFALYSLSLKILGHYSLIIIPHPDPRTVEVVEHMCLFKCYLQMHLVYQRQGDSLVSNVFLHTENFFLNKKICMWLIIQLFSVFYRPSSN